MAKKPIKYYFPDAPVGEHRLEAGYTVLDIRDGYADVSSPEQIRLAQQYGGEIAPDEPIVNLVEKKSAKKAAKPE